MTTCATKAQMHKVVNNLITPYVLPNGQVPERLQLYYFVYLFRSVKKAVLVVI